MIVDQVSTHVVGGAAAAARRLHEGLREQGIESCFWHSETNEADELDSSYQRIVWPEHRPHSLAWAYERLRSRVRGKLIRRRRRRALRGRPEGLEQFTIPELGGLTRIAPSAMRGDILHLHWVANLIDYPSFFASLPEGQPVVWTLHDMNPLTGGCHYSNSCDAFETGCQYCPQLGRPAVNDLASRAFQIKSESLRGTNLHVVSPSRWLLREAQRSRLLRDARSFQYIPYGLETNVFVPRDRSKVRQELAVPDDSLVVAFVAESIENQRKGFTHLLAALSHLGDRRIMGLVLGAGTLPIADAHLPPMRSVGFVKDPQRRAGLYAAADVLVLPSLEDNLPQTGLEALACETPVVAFNVGGIPEYVIHEQTGLLAPPADSQALARFLAWLADSPRERRQMGENGRSLILAEYRLDIQARRYVELYRSLVSNTPEQRERAA